MVRGESSFAGEMAGPRIIADPPLLVPVVGVGSRTMSVGAPELPGK